MEILLSESEIADRVADVADRIAGEIEPDWIAVALLDGGLTFAADLIRALSHRGVDVRYDALRVTTYGDSTKAADEPRLLSNVTRPVKGATCLLIDEVFDSGRTLEFAYDTLIEAGAESVKAVVFAEKNTAISPRFKPEWSAWTAPDRFLVGYGMDLAGRYRGLPHIGAID